MKKRLTLAARALGAALMIAVLLVPTAAPTRAQDAAPGGRLVLLSKLDGPPLPENIEILEQYGEAFVLARLSEGQLAALPEANVYDRLADRTVISLNGTVWDTQQGEPAIAGSLRSAPDDPYFLVQFYAPPKEEWKADLEAMGVTFLGYHPSYTYIVRMDPALVDRVRAAHAVQWVGAYHPAYRLATEAEMAIAEVDNGRVAVEVRGFPDGDTAALQADLERAGASIWLAEQVGPPVIRVWATPEMLPRLAALPGVYRVEPFDLPRETNDKAVQSSHMWDVWKAGRSGLLQDLMGAGQIAGSVDSGLDNKSTSPTIEDFYDWTNGAQTTRVQYNANSAGCGGNCSATDTSGHGTHTSGTIVGNGYNSLAQRGLTAYATAADPSFDYAWGAGMAPEAKIAMVHAGDGSGGIWTTPATDWVTLYNQGARSVNNSWGGGGYSYSTNSVTADNVMWTYQDHLIVVSAGNTGPNTSQIANPANAKNILSVGASTSHRPSNGWYSETSSALVYFSSRGPVATSGDTRFKPDIVAPGANVLSTRTNQAAASTDVGWGNEAGIDGGDGDGDNDGSPDYAFNGGTSMSAPMVTGAATVVRDYFQDIQGFSNATPPSAALIKAALLNGAVDVGYGYEALTSPSGAWYGGRNLQGWGFLNVEQSIAPRAPRSFFFDDFSNITNSVHQSTIGFTTSGTYKEYTVKVTDSSEPLKVTLTWTDYQSGSSGYAVNNLNLLVTSPSSTSYYGNVFSGSWSTTGGSYDAVNNTEVVYLKAPAAGTWTIRVTDFAHGSGTQPYALFVSGGLGANPTYTRTDASGRVGTSGTTYAGSAAMVSPSLKLVSQGAEHVAPGGTEQATFQVVNAGRATSRISLSYAITDKTGAAVTGASVSFNPAGPFTLAAAASQQVVATITAPGTAGAYDVSVTATASSASKEGEAAQATLELSAPAEVAAEQPAVELAPAAETGAEQPAGTEPAPTCVPLTKAETQEYGELTAQKAAGTLSEEQYARFLELNARSECAAAQAGEPANRGGIESVATGYTWSIGSSTYTEITGGTVACSGPTSCDEVSYSGLSIGFSFTYDGSVYTTAGLSTNGVLVLGSGTLTTYVYSPLSTTDTTYNNVVAAMGGDLQARTTSPYGELRYQTIGSSPNRVFVAQWKNWRHYNNTSETYNFQVRLSETSNLVEVVYGTTTGSTSSYTYQIGLRGASNADFNNRTCTNCTNWAGTSPGAYNSDPMTMSSTYKPATNLTWDWAPVAVPNLSTSTKTADKANANVGDKVTYTIQMINTGTGAATGAAMNDPIPTGATYNSDVSCTAGTPGYSGGAVTWSGTVPALSTVTCTFSVNIASATCGSTMANTATISATGISPFTRSASTAIGTWVLPSEGFEGTTFPPTGWGVVDNASSGCVWVNTDPGSRGNLTPGGSGKFAIVDSDNCGSGSSQDTELRTPTLNLSSYSNVRLNFKTYFRYYGTEYADVDYSTNGGTTWTNFWRKTAADYSGAESIDVSAYVAGQSNVKFRFHYWNASYEWYWEVDDAAVLGCGAAGPNLTTSTKTATATALAGESVYYTINMINTGSVAASGAAMNDPIPSGATYNSDVSCTAGTPGYSGGAVTWSGTVPASSSVTCTFSVSTAGVSCPGTMNNTATISATGISPFTRSASTTVSCATFGGKDLLVIPLNVVADEAISNQARIVSLLGPQVSADFWASGTTLWAAYLSGESHNNAEAKVWASCSSDGGVTWTNVGQVDGADGAHYYGPVVAGKADGSSVTFVWLRPNVGVYARTWTRTSGCTGTWRAVQTLATYPGGNYRINYPDVIYDTDGTILATWRKNDNATGGTDGIISNQSTTDGVSWAGAAGVPDASGADVAHIQAQLALDTANNDVWMAYQNSANSGDIYVKRWIGSTNLWATTGTYHVAVATTTNVEARPGIGYVAATGSLWVTWHRYASVADPSARLYYTRSTAGTLPNPTWLAAQQYPTGVRTAEEQAAMVVGDASNSYISYEAYSDGFRGSNLYALRVPAAGGAPAETFQLSATSDDPPLYGKGNSGSPKLMWATTTLNGSTVSGPALLYTKNPPDNQSPDYSANLGVAQTLYNLEENFDVYLVQLGITPTAVTLKSFKAFPEAPAVHVRWETVQEIDNLGFNLYRSNTRAGLRTKLNAQLIPSLVPPGSPFGAVYDYLDTFRLRPGRRYFYWLEAVDLYGNTETFGPARAVAP